ncbi:MAG: cadherin domain-containing protein, partial [Porticoccaceae bacterium]|nr:cadherin domain-containing protein [Porticoccaceae bacterium]
MSNYQKVFDDGIVWDGNTGTLVVKYETNVFESGSTGIGLRVHFDSNSMEVVSQDVQSFGALLIPSAPTVESENFDDNTATDSYIGLNYVAFAGGWPGALSQDIATITFQKVDGGNDNYEVDYSPNSQPPLYDEFIAEPTLPEAPLVPMSINVNPIDENSGAEQIIASVENAPENATFTLVDNTEYGAQTPVETLINIPEQAANTANIYVSDATFSEDGSQVTVQVAYNGESSTSGLGLLVHYDSSAVSLPQTPTVDSFGALVIGPSILPDSDNNDNNPETDSVLNVAWAGFMGGWPGTNAADLVELTFDVADGTTNPIVLNFSSTSTPPGIEFAGQDQIIQLPSADPSELSINPETGDVTLSVNPDADSRSEYSFDIIANAGGESEQTASATLQIVSVDILPPVINSGDTAVSIDENSGDDQVVYNATVDDLSDVTFSLASGSDASFSIDAVSGAVSLTTNPDYEAQSQYSFTVVATDAAGNAAEQLVSMSVNNLDELAPTITSATSISIDENSGANQVIYTTEVDDSSDTSAGVTFSLADGSDASLNIDSETGAVTLVVNPDQESQDQYSFTVVATDAAGNASEQPVSLVINDVDDTAPAITSGGFASSLDENSGVNQIIYTATSDDTGITFSLADGSDAALSIDAATGEVSLSTDPDYEAQSQYNFTVVATDVAGNASAAQSVTLEINNVDDTAPAITSSDTAVTIDE